MGLTDMARRFLAPWQKTAGSQQAWNAVFSTGIDNWVALFGTAKLSRPFAQHPTVYAAVSAISQSIAALPLEMFPDSDTKREEPIKDSEVLALLKNPGPDVDGPQLMEGTIDYMELQGEAFWFLDGFARRQPSGPQLPTSITLWDPMNTRADIQGGRVVRWGYQDSGDVFWTTPDRVVQFKHFNPYDPIRGLAPLAAAMIPAQGGFKALVYQDAFFENGCTFGGLLTPKEGAIIQPEAMARLRSELEARHQGSAKRGKLATINAPIDYKEIGISQKDMDFPDWLDASSALILMVFKVPPSVAGLQKDANYNASVQQAKQFWFNHLPLAHYLERRIKARLCNAFGVKESPYFKTESIKAMTEDQLALSNQARNLFNMGVAFRDINDRLELGYPADDLAANTRWVPFSLVNADDQAQALVARQQSSGNPNPPGQQNQPGDMPTQTNPNAGKSIEATREFTRTLSWKILISKVRTEEEAYARAVRQHLYLLRTEMLANLRGRKGLKLIGDINVETIMFDEDKAAKDIEKKTDPLYKSSIQKGAETVIAELHLNIDFDLLSPQVAKFLHEKMFEIADLIDGPLASDLRFQLEEGVRLGESVDKIAARVTEVFDVQRFRAYRIARTEVAESFNGGRYATMKEAGVERIEWLSARDDRVRDSHQEVDGEVIILGDHFSNGLLYPLDPAGPPEEIVNCFPAATIVEGQIVAGLQVEYIGPMIEIVTRLGHRLSITPKHPILTPDGLIPADELCEGAYLLSKDTKRESELPAAIVNYDDHGPASIEQIFHAIWAQGALSFRKIRPHDLHGDAEFTNGDVNVVLSHGKLLDRDQAVIAQGDCEAVLVGSAMGQAKISGYRPSLPPFHRIGVSASGGPGSGALLNNRGPICLEPGPLRALRLGAISQFNAPSLELARQDSASYPAFLSELIDACSGLITPDKIVSIRKMDFSGHVYDLQSISGWIIAQNIITSNCRCLSLPVA